MYHLYPETNLSYGYQNLANYCAYPPYTAPPPPLPGPEVIGEGEVKTVLLPDGSVQHYFLPTASRCPLGVAQCNGQHAYPPIHETPNSMWHIKPTNWNPPHPAHNGNEYQRIWNCAWTSPPMQSDPNVYSETAPFQLKFHNDGWTSTTDIHHFYPSIRGQWASWGAWPPPPPPPLRDYSCAERRMSVDDLTRKRMNDKSCKCTMQPVTSEKSVITYCDQANSVSIQSGTQTAWSPRALCECCDGTCSGSPSRCWTHDDTNETL